MLKKVLLSCFILLIIISSTSAQAINLNNILPQGRIRITDFEVPNMVNAGEIFTINVTIRNDRFLPSRIMLRVDLLDGILELITKIST